MKDERGCLAATPQGCAFFLPLFGLIATVLSLGCQPEGSRLVYRHMSQHQRAEAKQRWEVVRSGVKLQLAEQHLAAGRLDDTEDVLEQAIALAPDNPRAHLLSTRVRLERGELAKARQAITLAASMSTGDPEIDYFAGIVAQRYGDLQTAREHYSTAAMRAPNVAAYVLAQAETLVALDKPADALLVIQPRIRDFDGNVPMRMLAARIDLMLGLRGPAAEHCREALRWGNDDPVLRAEIGTMLVRAERYPEAIAILRPLADDRLMRDHSMEASQPDDTHAMMPAVTHALARAYLATGQWHQALELLKPIIAEDEQDVLARRLYASAALMLGDFDAMSEGVAKAHQQSAPTPETLLMAGYAALRQQNYAATLDAAGAALKVDTRLISAHCLIGQAAAAMGRPERARKAYLDALVIDPRSQVVRSLLEKIDHQEVPADGTLKISANLGHPPNSRSAGPLRPTWTTDWPAPVDVGHGGPTRPVTKPWEPKGVP